MQANDFFFEVARGRRTGFTPIHAFGSNGDVDAAEDIFAVGGSIPFATTAQSLEILSSDAADAAAGTGARTVFIEGVDASWVYKSEVATLNGVGAVALTGTWLRVNKATVRTAGTGLTNAGTITVRIAAAGATWVNIPISEGHSNGAYYSVPVGFRLFVTSFQGSVSSAGTITFGLFGNEDGVKRLYASASYALASSPFRQPFETPKFFGPRSDVVVRVTAVSAADQVVAGGLTGVLLSDAAV
jgi:hypothetical protein